MIAELIKNTPSSLINILKSNTKDELKLDIIREYIDENFKDFLVTELSDDDKVFRKSIRSNIQHNIEIKKGAKYERSKTQSYVKTEGKESSRRNNKWRVVHDFRALNKVTEKDTYPFDDADTLINQTGNSRLFTKFDFIMGYFQVIMNPEHSLYTAFTTHIVKVLIICRENDLFISKDKTELFKQQIEFLGFELSKDGVSPRKAKIKAITEIPEPLEKNIVQKSTDLPILSNKNLFEGAYHLYCDASDRAISGVLYQIQDSVMKPIWFHSRKLTGVQKKYGVGDREMLAIFDSLQKFKHLLFSKKVAVYTDHKNILFILRNKGKNELSLRQNNYISFFDEFNLEVLHIEGKSNKIADLLSRKFDNCQWEQSFLQAVHNKVNYLIQDGCKKLILTEKDTILTILKEYHDTIYSGHHALESTYNSIKLDYYFKELYTTVKRFIQSCDVCQANIHRKPTGLSLTEIPNSFQKYGTSGQKP
ncbi:hypothetical protein CYY_009774 [Polysphondylium violaceum]|uniref:Uncharacterized protein n=1 Tax=Polysphondylium violaceum TaxID=133409 RepID=A0A8J4PJP2_9MYCE|nr:hypothetical protein CYY_009774 [Polysphondylium violaceum]